MRQSHCCVRSHSRRYFLDLDVSAVQLYFRFQIFFYSEDATTNSAKKQYHRYMKRWQSMLLVRICLVLGNDINIGISRQLLQPPPSLAEFYSFSSQTRRRVDVTRFRVTFLAHFMIGIFAIVNATGAFIARYVCMKQFELEITACVRVRCAPYNRRSISGELCGHIHR